MWTINCFKPSIYICPPKGLVVFLEEDQYVSEDFLHVIQLANEERLQRHTDVDLISLGYVTDSPDFRRRAGFVSLSLL